ncbi:MAG: 3-oxoacyl-[acyl-carrier-protein] reductase [Phycisphaerae bacterium]|nr:3-oxoacyl-[acyl-carrier-protein] reductase [Phycisphaerae bacterium]
MKLKDQVAIVTGAARGIGREICLALADEGAHIAGVDLLADALAETQRLVEAKGVQMMTCEANVADRASVERMRDAVVEKFGRIDILVNNAGITRDTLMLSMTEEQWDAVIQVNLRGVFICSRVVAETMLRARYGRIINMASVSGLMGNPGQANYAASKAGVVGFTKSIAKELAKRNILCNAVAPGFIATDMTAVLPDKVKDTVRELIPARRFGEASEVASVVQFLAGPDAAYVTGQVISVDGGLNM